MTLEQLRIFIAVAERQHVTQGARDLNLTQSATSAAIAALEERYATKLFDRVGRRIELTDAGRLFLAEAKAVLARAGAAEQVLVDLAEPTRGSLTLAGSQTVGNYWLPAIVQRYRLRYPGVTMTVRIGNTEQVASMVREGTADLGFVEGTIDDAALAASVVADDEMLLVVPPGHAWAKRKPKSPAAWQAGPWVLRERGSGTRALFEALLPGWGVQARDLNVALELPSNEAVRTAVKAGAGATVISRLVVDSALKARDVVEVAVPLQQRHFYALRHKERYVSRAAQALLALIQPRTKSDASAKRKRPRP